LKSLDELPPLPGRTVVLVDVSGSMTDTLSAKSDLTRMDAAATLASIVPGDVRVFTFSSALVECPPYKGMAGVEFIKNSQEHTSTALGSAVDLINRNVPHDRMIVITDEQSADSVEPPACLNGYMINVASYQNRVGYGNWTRIDGFSENVLRWIAEHEKSAG
jgi:predicted metal-dependent peptidase